MKLNFEICGEWEMLCGELFDDFTEVTDFTEVIMEIGMIPLRQDAELPPIQM
jgi:hypothetical protein